MKILLVAGGSGGHIYPCLELAKYFKEKGETIFLAGSKNSLEESIYKANNFDFYGLDIKKNNFKSYIKNCKNINKLYNDKKIDLVILFGNYISVSFGLSAIIKKVPIYLHEQNVIYGRANKLLGLKAKRIYLALPIKKDIYANKSMLVGNPKAEITTSKIYMDKRYYNVVIVMGSLGSSSINQILKDLIKENKFSDIIYHIVVGKKYYDSFINEVNYKDNIIIYPYLDDLTSYLKECDIFVSRAGATTISEIIYNNVVSVLIPSPYVKDNHQYLNAKYLEDNNGCVLVEEKQIDGKKLNDIIRSLIKDYDKRMKIKMNLRKLKITDCKNKIYEDIKSDYM